MSPAIALALLVLLQQPDPLATARRFMLEGELPAAIPILESVVDTDSPGRSRAGLLLELYSPDTLVLHAEEAEDLLIQSDTVTADGELMLLSGKLGQLNSASESPFPMIYASAEDPLNPEKHSWSFTLPVGLSEAEVKPPGGRWYAVPLSALVEGTVTRIEQR